jgi:hypothetical protein
LQESKQAALAVPPKHFDHRVCHYSIARDYCYYYSHDYCQHRLLFSFWQDVAKTLQHRAAILPSFDETLQCATPTFDQVSPFGHLMMILVRATTFELHYSHCRQHSTKSL